MSSIFSLARLTAFVAAALTTASVSAGFDLSLDVPFSGKVNANGSPPWLTVHFEDTAANEVEMTLTSLLTSPNVLKDKGLYLNFDPALSLASLVFTHLSGVEAADIDTGVDAFKADGTGGDFDILFGFGRAGKNPLPVFGAGDTSKYKITGTGLTAQSFNFRSSDSPDNGGLGYYAAAHVQSLVGGGSTWIGDNGPDEGPTVPEPGTLALLAIGSIGLGGAGYRRRRTAQTA